MGSDDGETGYDEVADLYDHVDVYESRDDVDFYVGMAGECAGPVLELGCGTGRILLPTARAGHAIVGVDSSTHMLAICRRKLEVEAVDVQERVELQRLDMRFLDLGRTFSLITTPFRSFQHLITVEDQLACLRSVRHHLTDDGRFVLDVFFPMIEHLADQSKLEESVELPEKLLPDGRRVSRNVRIVANNYLEQHRLVELIYYVTHPDGRQERLMHRFRMRYFFRYEIEHLFHRAGLELEQVYADYDRRPFGAVYPGEQICVARKG